LRPVQDGDSTTSAFIIGQRAGDSMMRGLIASRKLVIPTVLPKSISMTAPQMNHPRGRQRRLATFEPHPQAGISTRYPEN
jgi:hypothetical protein